MTITSTAFQSNEFIPPKYTCDGENINPPLTLSKVPKEAQSIALVVEDPDAPSGIFTHWLLYNIPSSTLQILENEVPPGSIQGKNDFGNVSYGGPCPPSGTHRYFFKLFALDKKLNLPSPASKEELQSEMEGHVLEEAQIIGLYQR